MIVLHIPSWFPHPEKPLDGNFIIRQISTVANKTTSIVLHHVDIDFKKTCEQMMDDAIIFWPIFTQQGTSNIQMIRAYDYEVEKIIRKYGKPDLIHLHVALPLGPLAFFLSTRYHIPMLISEHWSIYQPQNRTSLTLQQRFFLRQTYRRARHLTTVSNDLHKAITETIHIARKIPFTQINNVVNTNLFHSNTEILPQKPGKKKILHVSTLENASKNIMGILRMTLKLSKIRQDFELNIIHDLRNEDVEQYIAAHNMEPFVHLLGKKKEEEVAEAVRACDFMLQFSNYENQPCVLLEAFCCGKPVVATSVGGIPEIANESNSLLVTPQDEDMLLRQTEFMLDHAQNYDASAISSNAKHQYTSDIIGENFMKTYRKILSGN